MPSPSAQDCHGRRRRRASRNGKSNKSVSSRELVTALSLLCLALVSFWAVTLIRSVQTLHWTSGQRHVWNNSRGLVHVVQTRFMQFQPNLLALGKARLALFESMTVHSMQRQTVQEFLWIIRTDPDLDASLKSQLIRIVEKVPNAVLVASNENPEGFRNAVSDITAETVLAGSLAAVESYHEAAHNHCVLETRLDADDAVAVDFCEILQTSAAQNLVATVQADDQSWMVWCAENHVEWQYDSPWGDTTNTTNNTNTGALLGLKSGKCITPGLTWGYAVGAGRSEIPVSKHHQIHDMIPACKLNDNDNPQSLRGGGTDNDDDDSLKTRCLVKLGGELPLALRARTPTSAGMDHVFIAEHTENHFPMQRLQHSKWKNSQDDLWKSLPALFGVYAADLWRVRAGFAENLPSIVKDALDGQCTKGHSCKNGSRAVLEQLLNTSETTSIKA